MNKAEILSRVVVVFGFAALFRKITGQMQPSQVRIVNYHHVEPHHLPNFEHQLDLMLSLYQPVTLTQLIRVIDGQEVLDRPGILLTFDDGFQSHASYVAQALEKRNIEGCFFVPTAVPDVPVEEQLEWAYANRVLFRHERPTFEERLFANWDAWSRLADRHVVASHTHEHVRFTDSVQEAEVMRQLNTSVALLEQNLGSSRFRNVFCYVGGELTSYSPQAANAIVQCDFDLAFTTCSKPSVKGSSKYRVERTNIEASFSDYRVLTALSGLIDIRYSGKRKALDPIFKAHSTLGGGLQ